MSSRGFNSGPSGVGQPPTAGTVGDLDLIHRSGPFFGVLRGQTKAQFGRWWTDVRNRLRTRAQEITALEAERSTLLTRIQLLEAENATLKQATAGTDIPAMPPSSATRPTTSDSDRTRAAQRQTDLDTRGDSITASNTTQRIKDLPPDWVRGRLQQMRNATVENSDGAHGPSGTGCWMTRGTASDHPNGYSKVNWQHTVKPVARRDGSFNQPTGGAHIGANAFRHHLAVVASGAGQDLVHTVKGTGGFEVSHLCNNGRCFNPAHVRVETQAQNEARKQCVANTVIVLQDGTVLHPCTHAQGGNPRCILPRWRMPADHTNKTWYEPDSSRPGNFRRRGP